MRLAGGTRARARSPGRAAASGCEAVRLGALPASRRGRRVAAGHDDEDFAQSRQIARQEARRWPADESRAPSRPGLGACSLDLERRHGGVDTCEGNSQTKVRPMARPRGVRDARPNRNVERRASRSRRPRRRPPPPGAARRADLDEEAEALRRRRAVRARRRGVRGPTRGGRTASRSPAAPPARLPGALLIRADVRWRILDEWRARLRSRSPTRHHPKAAPMPSRWPLNCRDTLASRRAGRGAASTADGSRSCTGTPAPTAVCGASRRMRIVITESGAHGFTLRRANHNLKILVTCRPPSCRAECSKERHHLPRASSAAP